MLFAKTFLCIYIYCFPIGFIGVGVTLSLFLGNLCSSCTLIQARSVVMATIADMHYLFVGLGDGHVVSFPLEVTAESGLILGSPKKVALGTQPVGLACFRNNGMVCVFVASDRPAVIYCSGGKLLYAKVNMGEVKFCILSTFCSVGNHMVFVTSTWCR